MANIQTSPNFVKGQIPTAAQWNGYFSSKQDALIATVSITGNSTAVGSACKYVVDTTLGVVTLIIPPSLGQSGKENCIRVVKRSATPNTNQVILNNGTSDFAFLINENNNSGAGWLDIYMNGTAITDICGVP